MMLLVANFLNVRNARRSVGRNLSCYNENIDSSADIGYSVAYLVSVDRAAQ